jgi:hypothetical protein
MDLSATFNFLSNSDKPIVLRRLTYGGMVLDVQCLARVTLFNPQAQFQIEQAGGIAQGDRQCIISNTEIDAKGWPGPPRRGDILVILDEGVTTSVLGCDVSDLGGTRVRHNLTLRGGG